MSRCWMRRVIRLRGELVAKIESRYYYPWVGRPRTGNMGLDAEVQLPALCIFFLWDEGLTDCLLTGWLAGYFYGKASDGWGAYVTD